MKTMSYKECIILSVFTTAFMLSVLAVPPRAGSLSYGDEANKAISTSGTVQTDNPVLNGLQWNRYVSGNYVILSIDDKQGKWFCKNIQRISSFCTSRWGLSEPVSTKECRIFCVPSESLLKELFNLDGSKVDVRSKDDGSTSINVIWTHLDNFNDESVAPYITAVIFSGDGCNYPFWFSKAAEILSSSCGSIKDNIKIESFSEFNPATFFSLSREDYLKLPLSKRELFDQQSVVCCLMLRKELGQRKLVSLISTQQSSKPDSKNSTESDLKLIYGYKNFEEFGEKCKCYCKDLLDKLEKDEVPDSYFFVKPFEGRH